MKLAATAVLFVLASIGNLYGQDIYGIPPHLRRQHVLSQNIEEILRNEYLPEKVRDTLRDSIVLVFVERWNELQGAYIVDNSGTGIVMDGRTVQTDFHILAVRTEGGGYFIDKSENSRIFVTAHGADFPAKIVDYIAARDQILIEVSELDFFGEKSFDKKPAKVSAVAIVPKSGREFFAAGFKNGTTLLFAKFETFQGYLRSQQYGFIPRGYLLGPVDGGFSGGPVMDSDGRVRGMVVGTENSYATFIPGEDMIRFLDNYKERIAKDPNHKTEEAK